MLLCHDVAALHQARGALSGRVGLVPTMGALHAGHVALMRQLAEACDHVIVSVFVNPTQFGPHEDFAAYPRDLAADAALCAQAGVSLVFAPSVDVIYPPGDATEVRVRGMTDTLCGPGRPGHFEGVTTVVCRLFNLTRPDVAIFGQKDYQQLAILRRMTRDLHLGVEVVGAPTVREVGGLAMSSRNRYLSDEERLRARVIARGLADAHAAWRQGAREPRALEQTARAPVEAAGLKIEYVEAVHPETLAIARGAISDEDGCVIGVATRLGRARLIDNLRLDDPLPPALAALDMEP